MNYRKWYRALPTQTKRRIERIIDGQAHNSNEKIMQVLLGSPEGIPLWMSDRSERLAQGINTYVSRLLLYNKM
jgi:hypothetical protein